MLFFPKNFASTLEDIFEKMKKKIVCNPSNVAKTSSHAGRGANRLNVTALLRQQLEAVHRRETGKYVLFSREAEMCGGI